MDPNRFRCYFTRHSLRFVYVNIYVKCALGFYKCHREGERVREREGDRNRKKQQNPTVRCALFAHTTSDILKASPMPRYNPLGCNQFSSHQPRMPWPREKKLITESSVQRDAQVTICTCSRRRCSGGRSARRGVKMPSLKINV